MGAASVDLPTIGVSGGPMLSGKYRGGELGSGTGVWQMSEAVRAGTMTQADFFEAESCMHRSHGHCMTMGTASTMACMVEALGMGLPGNAAIPAVDGRRNVLARMAGRRIVQMVEDDLVMSKILTRAAFENAIRANAAIGGSTNAVIHLLALAGRAGVKLALEDWDTLRPRPAVPGRSAAVGPVPDGRLLLRRRTAGRAARTRRRCSNRDALTVNGQHDLGQRQGRAALRPREDGSKRVIRPLDDPFKAKAGIAVLRGNLAPDGAVIKPSAATPALMQHRGRAVVFEDSADMHAKVEDESLDVRARRHPRAEELRPEGLSGHGRGRQHADPGQAGEAGRHRHGAHLGCAHERHGLRHRRAARRAGSRGRRQPRAGARAATSSSSTSSAAACISKSPTPNSRAVAPAWKAPAAPMPRGYTKLYFDHVQQADKGADLDFLVGGSGSAVAKDNH